MFEFLQHVFGCVCGQDPGHTWSPGGVMLPFCQRCTGLYVGAFVAGLLHLALRPGPSNRWLWLNGAFLLVMIPFGFHWLPQGPFLRTATGVLFGFGLVAFLTLAWPAARSREGVLPDPAASGHQPACPSARLFFWLPLVAALMIVPWLGARGNSLSANLLILLATLGAFVLCGLGFVNIALALRWLIRRLFRRDAGAFA